MKQKDFILIGLVVVISCILSYFVSSSIFSTSKTPQTKVPVADTIDPSFPQPDPLYFNSNSTDPTQIITIGNGTNTTPFNNNGQ